jgi:hypothetical protein
MAALPVADWLRGYQCPLGAVPAHHQHMIRCAPGLLVQRAAAVFPPQTGNGLGKGVDLIPHVRRVTRGLRCRLDQLQCPLAGQIHCLFQNCDLNGVCRSGLGHVTRQRGDSGNIHDHLPPIPCGGRRAWVILDPQSLGLPWALRAVGVGESPRGQRPGPIGGMPAVTARARMGRSAKGGPSHSTRAPPLEQRRKAATLPALPGAALQSPQADRLSKPPDVMVTSRAWTFSPPHRKGETPRGER